MEQGLINVYSLPDLQFRDQLSLWGVQLRADSDGVVYVASRGINVVEISNTGKLSVQRV